MVDRQGFCAGDRAIDLATLLFYRSDAPVVRDRLRHEVLARASAGAVTVYLCHRIPRQPDCSSRRQEGRIARFSMRWARVIVRDLEQD